MYVTEIMCTQVRPLEVYNIYYEERSKIMQVKLFLRHCLYLICTNFSWFALKNIFNLPGSESSRP